jgi:hypothetical protein
MVVTAKRETGNTLIAPSPLPAEAEKQNKLSNAVKWLRA